MTDPTVAPEHDPTHWCPRCERGVAASKCRPVELGDLSGAHVLLCATCGAVTRPVDVVERADLTPLYVGALTYPVSTGHLPAFLGLSSGVWFFSHVPLVGDLFAAAIAVTYLLSVVPHTAKGRDSLPEPTDFVHFTDYLWPASRALVACLVGFAPLLAVLLYGGALPFALRAIFTALTGAVALAWLPGAMAWASIAGRVADAADPRPVLAIVTRAPRDYALTVAAVWGLGVAHVILVTSAVGVARSLCFVPIVPSIGLWAAGIYMPMVMARVVGLLLRARRVEIGVDV